MSTRQFTELGQSAPSGGAPMACHCPATYRAGGQARTTGKAAAVCALAAAAGFLAGCVSSATGPPRALPARAHVSAGDAPAAARVFVSRNHGYTVALPAGWSARAAQPWQGPGSRGIENGGVDVFRGMPYTVVWGFAVPAPASLAAYATATTRAVTQLPCPAVPQIDQHVTIGGAPARLIGMRCPAQGGALMLTAVTTHHHTALVFIFEDSSGMMAAGQADSVAFREFLAGIRIGDTQKRMLCAPKSTCPALTSHVRNRCSACP